MDAVWSLLPHALMTNRLYFVAGSNRSTLQFFRGGSDYRVIQHYSNLSELMHLEHGLISKPSPCDRRTHVKAGGFRKNHRGNIDFAQRKILSPGCSGPARHPTLGCRRQSKGRDLSRTEGAVFAGWGYCIQ